MVLGLERYRTLNTYFEVDHCISRGTNNVGVIDEGLESPDNLQSARRNAVPGWRAMPR